MRAAAACLLVLALSALAGCGGSGDDEGARADGYVDAVDGVQQRFARDAERLGGLVSSTSTPQSDRRALAAFETAVTGAARRLRAIDPPDGVRGEHARLVRALTGYGTLVRREARALDTGEAVKVERARDRLQRATTEIARDVNATVDQINAELR